MTSLTTSFPDNLKLIIQSKTKRIIAQRNRKLEWNDMTLKETWRITISPHKQLETLLLLLDDQLRL